MTKSLLIGVSSIFLVFKYSKFSMLNRIFIAGGKKLFKLLVLSTGFYYVFSLQMRENILNKLIGSQTHFGQESRIL